MQDFRFADMHIQAPETPGRFSLRLGVYPPAQVLQLNGCCCHRTPASHVVEGVTNSRVPSLHGHYPASALLRTPPSPSRIRLISRWTSYTTYLASADFAAGRGGSLQLLGVSLSPCCRSHPAGAREPSQSVFGPPCSLRPSGCGLGLRIFSLSRPPMRSLALRPGDSPASRRCCCRWASEIRFPSSLPSELQGS